MEAVHTDPIDLVRDHEPSPLPARDAAGAEPEHIELRLVLRDPEVVGLLGSVPEGRARRELAETALRIGVLALQRARGEVDAVSVRREGDRLVGELERRLADHQQTLHHRMTAALERYFDPASGELPQRIERLVRKDGDLEGLLRRQVGDEDSELARTLARHLGEHSPLMAWLSPDAAEGLQALLAKEVARAVELQREQVLAQFSLDDRGSALSRLLGELREHHGKLDESFQERVGQVVGEFSLDDEDSALSRLVRRVEQAERRISSEFSLDEESSALARMRRELMQVFEGQRDSHARFQEEVRVALEGLRARREESLRSTRHGEDFEAEVLGVVEAEARRRGDVADHVGLQTGYIPRSKVGDVVLELGPETAAAGARVVFEAKQEAGYDLGRAREEIETARRNRNAGVGVFVFSARSAPEGIEPLERYGDDLVVVFDPEGENGDLYLTAAISLARALCTGQEARRASCAADFEAIDRAVRAVEKQASSLGEIATSGESIRQSAEKILDRVERLRRNLGRQVGRLDQHIDDLKESLSER